MSDVFKQLAQQAVGVSWDENPFLRLGLGQEFLALDLQRDDLRAFIQQYIRTGLRLWHPDVAKNDPVAIRRYHIFAAVNDLMSKPGALEVAADEFKDLFVSRNIQRQKQMERDLMAAQDRAKMLEKEKQVAVQGLYNTCLEREKAIEGTKRALRTNAINRFTALISAKAFDFPRWGHIAGINGDEVEVAVISFSFHKTHADYKKGRRPGDIICDALAQEDVLLPVVWFNARAGKSLAKSPPQSDLPVAVASAYRRGLATLGNILGEQTKLPFDVLLACGRRILIRGDRYEHVPLWKEKKLQRAVLGTIPCGDDMVGTFEEAFTDEIVSPSYAYDNFVPALLEDALLISMNVRPFRDESHQALVYPDHHNKSYLRCADLIVKIL